MAEPTCPKCNAAGIEHFASKRSVQQSRGGDPWYFVIYCGECGHVYEILAKHVFIQGQTHRFSLAPSR
ncbi:MAG: transcriptional regulator [Gammaproteobacteria bacterium]|nr:transcriptional regulator [Gammaproteobacteria bacterium]